MSPTTSSNKQIQIGLVGYGNIGRGVELAIEQNPDMALVGIFTRRNPDDLGKTAQARLLRISELEKYLERIDVVLLCGGSATDLPEQGPHYAGLFNTVDSFDTHAKIPDYFAAMDRAARKAGKTSVISTGWDPGLFSMMRALSMSFLPLGKTYTFWGTGVSQGHSNAVRTIKGVRNAVQYTIPIKDSLKRVRAGLNPDLSTREMHRRVCYVVTEEGADREKIRNEIVTMPNYFAPYDTEVIFISEKKFTSQYSRMPHGGFVLRSGLTGENNKELMEFTLQLDSNPEFTGNIMVAYSRAVYRLNREGQIGAKTVFDIAPSYLSTWPKNELLKQLL